MFAVRKLEANTWTTPGAEDSSIIRQAYAESSSRSASPLADCGPRTSGPNGVLLTHETFLMRLLGDEQEKSDFAGKQELAALSSATRVPDRVVVEAVMGQAEEWKILAEEAAQEQEPEKLMHIIQALTSALDEKNARKNGNRNAAQQSSPVDEIAANKSQSLF